MHGPAPAPRFARPFVAAFLALLVAAPLAGMNPWPFPAWKLFSHLRTDRQTGWAAVAVDASGVEHDYPVGSLPHGYRGFGFLMVGFATRSPADRDAICAAWRDGARARFGSGIQAVRIDRLDWYLHDRIGRRAATPYAGLDLHRGRRACARLNVSCAAPRLGLRGRGPAPPGRRTHRPLPP